jgi:hypothetical protein
MIICRYYYYCEPNPSKLNGPVFQKLVPEHCHHVSGCLNDAQELGFQSTLWMVGHMTRSARLITRLEVHTQNLFVFPFPFLCRWADGNPSIHRGT